MSTPVFNLLYSKLPPLHCALRVASAPFLWTQSIEQALASKTKLLQTPRNPLQRIKTPLQRVKIGLQSPRKALQNGSKAHKKTRTVIKNHPSFIEAKLLIL